MGNACNWVRDIVAASHNEPMSTEAVLKSLDRFVGQDERSLARAQDILRHIDDELVARNDGPVMRDLWSTVSYYVEQVQEARAAA